MGTQTSRGHGPVIVAAGAVGASLLAAAALHPDSRVAAAAALDPDAAPYFRTEYFPGTEALAADEMRVIALGTGNPEPRKSQAAASWFVELGNGDKFFFDVGTGSQMNFPMLRVSYRDADKVFLSHLHTDHAGDLPELWIGGWVAGRYDRPLRVWGPSGQTPQLGTRHFVDMQKAAWTWDTTMRHGKLPAAGGEIEVNEFDYAKAQVVYAANGVRITSFPALHGIDGAVSYRLEWRDLTFVFSGDTTPTRFMLEHGSDADLLVHESIDTVGRMMRIWGWDRQTAEIVGGLIHTQPAAAGKVFSLTKPRLAVGYHFYNDTSSYQETYDAVRQTYAGPLVLARDGLVFNVTADDIRVRMLVGNEDTYPETIGAKEYASAKRLANTEPSAWLLESQLKWND